MLGVLIPAFGTAVGALLDTVLDQQNDAAAEWLAEDLAEASEKFTARKIVFMGPASRACDALHAVDEHRGDALLLNAGSEPDDPVDVGAPGSLTLAGLMPPRRRCTGQDGRGSEPDHPDQYQGRRRLSSAARVLSRSR